MVVSQQSLKGGLTAQIAALIGQARHHLARWQVLELLTVHDGHDGGALGVGELVVGCDGPTQSGLTAILAQGYPGMIGEDVGASGSA